MTRPRKIGNKDLPENLYYHKSSGKFVYYRPDTKTQHYVKGDRATAIASAMMLNAQLAPKPDAEALASSILGNVMPMSKWCDHFENVIIPELNLSPTTIAEYKNQLKRIKKHFVNNIDIGLLTLREVAKFLDEMPAIFSNRIRSLLLNMFKHAKSKGLVESNIIKDTMPKKTMKKRLRLTLEQYIAILNFKKEINGKTVEIPQFLKIAMRLAFVTTQRVEDIAVLQYQDIVNGCLRVRQQKTKSQLEIEIFPELQSVINDSRDSILSPFIVHRDPVKNMPFKGRTHYTQCNDQYISKAFSRIRDLLPEFKDMPPKEKPTFHEIRSTAIKYYEDNGFNVQFLAGHKDRKMTDHYKKGHDAWERIKVSGIKFEF